MENYKGHLQEYYIKKYNKNPEYAVENNNEQFRSKIKIKNTEFISRYYKKKKDSEQDVAFMVLKFYKIDFLNNTEKKKQNISKEQIEKTFFNFVKNYNFILNVLGLEDSDILQKNLIFAFTHRSALTTEFVEKVANYLNVEVEDIKCYEHLEMFGDSIINGLLINRAIEDGIYDKKELTNIKMKYANNEYFKKIMSKFDFYKYMIYGFVNIQIHETHLMSDLLESIIGAVYLSGLENDAKRIAFDLFKIYNK